MVNLDSDFDYKHSFVDQSSGAQFGLSHLHAKIHRGNAFKISQVKEALADDGFTYYEIVTPPDDDFHLKSLGLYINDGPVRLKIIENPILTTGTEEFEGVNKNRRLRGGVMILSGATIKANPTGISGGVILENLKLGTSGQGSNEEDLIFALQDEWVFPKGRKLYLISLQNKNGSAIDMSSRIVWYE